MRVKRTAIEYLAVIISGMAFIAAIGAFIMQSWLAGYTQGSIDGLTQRITDYTVQQDEEADDLKQRVAVLDIRKAKIEAKLDTHLEEHDEQ